MSHYDDSEHVGTGYSWPDFERPPHRTRGRVVMRDYDVRERFADDERRDADAGYGRRNRADDYYHGADPDRRPGSRYNDYYDDSSGEERGLPAHGYDYGRGVEENDRLDGFDRWLEGDSRDARRPAAGPHAGRGPKGYRRSDERIREDVCERLSRDGMIDASEMEVQVENGEVTLRGSADSRSTKRRATDLIEDLPGVRDVYNLLHLRS